MPIHIFPFSNTVLYLDPGTGSYLVQLLIASLLGAGVVIRLFWKQITGLFHRGKPENQLNPEDNDQE